MNQCNGIIKWFSDTKHFGFLQTKSENREIFFHVNDCSGFVPMEGISVSFEMGFDRKGRSKAIEIQKVCVGGSDEGGNS
jgi:cold shock CspA family protein